ncbi:aspartate aminotransferase [Penicillium taxi]|uniref:aspartate aminotransferase n=1 Tax=Penicillium taxi TaxID=168475 RepID=UPI002545A326|nr:aspartate aminotransferase [Penicillium taxi]KAJ5899270.1 aspartate aminotransferase [Penicillium taxi]
MVQPSASSTLHGRFPSTFLIFSSNSYFEIDTCVDPLCLNDLSQLGASDSSVTALNVSAPLIYGPSSGNAALHKNIRSLYADDVNKMEELSLQVTQGTISANFLVLDTLVGPGDHVICQYPTYQQLFDVPRRAGAEVSLWRTRAENGWIPDVTELTSLAKENTKLVIINTPNNPTGASIPRATLEHIVSFAAQRNIILLSDEVFRPLFHDSSAEVPPSILSFAGQYKNIIATSSVSKAYSLPGVRLGWVISPNPELIHQLAMASDFTTISVSQVDQSIATYALEAPIRAKILKRSLAICHHNLNLLDAFIQLHGDRLRWVKPTGAAAAFVCVVDRDGVPVDEAAYCESLVAQTGLLIVPGGKTFGTESDADFKGYLRVGFVCSSEKFEKALKIWDESFKQLASKVVNSLDKLEY